MKQQACGRTSMRMLLCCGMLIVAAAATVGCTRLVTTPLPGTVPSTSKALSREEQVQVLLLRRMLVPDKPYFERAGRTVYVSVGVDLHLVWADPQIPSNAMMAALGQLSFPVRRLSEYLKSVGGYDQWRQKGELIDVLWIGPLKWTDEETVEATAGRSLGPHESHGEWLRIHWEDGHWVITQIAGWKT